MDKRLKDYLEENGWDELVLLKSYATMGGNEPKAILLDNTSWDNFVIWRRQYLENFRERAYFQNGKIYYRFNAYLLSENKNKSISLMNKVMITKVAENLPELHDMDDEFYVSKDFPIGILNLLKQEEIIVKEYKTDNTECAYLHCLMKMNKLQAILQIIDDSKALEMS